MLRTVELDRELRDVAVELGIVASDNEVEVALEGIAVLFVGQTAGVDCQHVRDAHLWQDACTGPALHDCLKDLVGDLFVRTCLDGASAVHSSHRTWGWGQHRAKMWDLGPRI